MSDKVRAVAKHKFSADRELVYDAWLNPEKARVWMAASLRTMGLAGEIRRVEIDARVGGKFFFSDQRGDVEARHWGTYLELDRPNRVVFTWVTDESEEVDPSIVTLTLVSVGTGTEATIVHEMDAKWVEYVQQVEHGWGNMLKALGLSINT